MSHGPRAKDGGPARKRANHNTLTRARRRAGACLGSKVKVTQISSQMTRTRKRGESSVIGIQKSRINRNPGRYLIEGGVDGDYWIAESASVTRGMLPVRRCNTCRRSVAICASDGIRPPPFVRQHP